jgi:hypothetical protein
MLPSETPSLLRVQSVLFKTDPAHVWRLVRGLDAAARLVVEAGLVRGVEWALGDSSPSPIFSDADAEAMLAATSHLQNITYEFFAANLGSSGGQNRLARGRGGDLLLILNPDTYPSPTALVELVGAIDQPNVAIAEARQIPFEHPKKYEAGGGDTSWASGFCMLVRRSVFDAVGGFDDAHFLLHCDDVDLSWRVRAAGHRVVLAAAASVFHDKRPALGIAAPAPEVEQYYGLLGRLLLATRWQRPDIVQETIALAEKNGSDAHLGAVAEFRRREREGRIPAVARDASVAQFVDGEYAVHRF